MRKKRIIRTRANLPKPSPVAIVSNIALPSLQAAADAMRTFGEAARRASQSINNGLSLSNPVQTAEIQSVSANPEDRTVTVNAMGANGETVSFVITASAYEQLGSGGLHPNDLISIQCDTGELIGWTSLNTSGGFSYEANVNRPPTNYVAHRYYASYRPGDMVTFLGETFICLSPNIGVNPALNSSTWQRISM